VAVFTSKLSPGQGQLLMLIQLSAIGSPKSFSQMMVLGAR
jgi:hypothetical protein